MAWKSKYKGVEIENILDAAQNSADTLEAKQDKLVSGTNIKTINGTSILGSGNIAISGGSGTITEVKANGTSIATSGVANIPAASTSAYGVTKLSTATNSTSTTLAATASAVKSAYDLANSYKGTVTGVKINGSTKSPSSGTVDIGNVVTSVKVNGSTYSPSSGVVDLGTISGGGSSGGGSEYAGNYPIVRNNQYGDIIYLQPNVFTVLTTQYASKAIQIQLSAATNTNIVNEYIVAVYVNGDVSLYHPIDIVWTNNDEPIIESGYTYIMSFVDNIGMWTRVSGNIYNAQPGNSGSGSN